ncbi:TolB family protein [Catalinimonas niigatensis]|uniref:TolB family protein n=1 Tax=Catalinimonas niigatensis TaxID=1397264 RepID=UPI0026653F7D|nr:DUF5050 domain-containing protein [Catalinimonas niigatensis]WPP51200.1 DUF5050 domain-containing protein [Catalinimonas niigatensis]
MKPSMIIFISFFLFNFAHAQSPAIGIFDNSTDIGQPGMQGSAEYDEATQTYTLKGSGYNIMFEKDEFHFLHKKLSGDFILTANFKFEGDGVDPQRKVGWMLRETLSEDAAHISATLQGDGNTEMQWRVLNGAYMRDPEDKIVAPKLNYQILQLEREGKEVIMRAAHMGEPLQEIGSYKLESLSDEIYAGLIVSSQNENVVEEAKVWNVRITKPVADNFNGFLSSRLETMDVFDGTRKVVYESNEVIESPNWMPDGNNLLTTLGGKLYTIPIEGGALKPLNTGEIERINNDHGISFDGKQLAFTSNENVEIGPRIYTMPIEGGEPKLLTEKAPSYWHGWSANNKEVYYVAQRDTPVYNIYKIAVKGGEEKQLTHNTSGYVDGPESSPDGKYIYYNDNASGTMQIWRMKTDGTNPEQLTFDEYNNWFPHVSPDGKWIVFLTYDQDVPTDAHPSYKRVMLRLMSLSGGAPKVIANIYGGQGTMNVSSWSPDSRQISFVSNTGTEFEQVSRANE